MDEGVVAHVEFAYSAQESDELTLSVGDVVKNCIQKEDGWMEGTLNGKRGMFPDNFIKVQKQTKKSIPPPPPSIKPKKEVKIFVAVYTYDAANKDELSFKEGQKIEFIEDLEDGWATGKLLDNGIIGLYPTNFVESQPTTGQPIGPSSSTTTGLSADKSSDKKNEYYKVAFEYKADNNDELELLVGEYIKIISKNTADDGWWEGEVNGKKGVFPKNFVETNPSAPPTSSIGGKNAGSGLASPSSDFAKKQKTAQSVIMRTRPNDQTGHKQPIRPVSELPSNVTRDMNLIDNSQLKARPKGPRNKRPPNAANRRNNVEQSASPLQEDPPMEETPLETPEKPKPAPTSTQNSAKSPVGPPQGAFAMPGMSGINMNSLRKKQKQFESKGSVAPSESKIKEEPKEDNPPVPEWKKNLLRNRNGTKSMNKGSSDQNQTEEPQQTPPWVKEMKDKGKSFRNPDQKEEPEIKQELKSPSQKEAKPTASIRKPESFNRIDSSSSFTPSVSSTEHSTNAQTQSSIVQSATGPQPVSAIRPSLNHKKLSEPTLAEMADELKVLRQQVQRLSLRLDEECDKRRSLENKIKSLEMR